MAAAGGPRYDAESHGTSVCKTASMLKSQHRLYLCFIIVGWLGPLPIASAIRRSARAFAFAHCAPRTENEAGIGRRRAIATAGAAFVSGQVPIAVIASPVKDNTDPLAAFGASLSGSNGMPTGQQPLGATASATAASSPPLTPSSAASGPPTGTGGPQSSLDATLDQLSKKRTIDPRTHG